MKLTYDEVVSICDAHGICLPVDCVEMVVSIVEHIRPDHSGDGGEKAAAHVTLPAPDTTHYAQWAGDTIKYHSDDQIYEFASARVKAALASNKAKPEPAAGEYTPVNFAGINPLEIAKGAYLPMIPDSWRYGFRKTAGGFDFSFQDDGPLVAWDAVKDVLASNKAAAAAVGEPIEWTAHWAGSNPYKGWSIRSGRDEVIWFGETVSSETVEGIVLAHNRCFDCEGDGCVMNCSGLRPPAPIASTEEAVAEVESWTNGSYHRNYKLRWLKDVEAGAKLYAAAQPSRAEVLEEACAAIKAEDDRQADNDYMLDSDDCIRVIRELKEKP